MIYFTKDLQKDLADARSYYENSIKEAKEFIHSVLESAQTLYEENEKERTTYESKHESKLNPPFWKPVVVATFITMLLLFIF